MFGDDHFTKNGRSEESFYEEFEHFYSGVSVVRWFVAEDKVVCDDGVSWNDFAGKLELRITHLDKQLRI